MLTLHSPLVVLCFVLNITCESEFSMIAHQLAVQTDSILLIFLTKRTGKLSFSIEYFNLTDMIGTNIKKSKKEIIQDYIKLYAEILEDFLKKNPYMWFNFFNFWEKSIE